MVTEEEEEGLPYGHLEHEVLLAETEADVCDRALEEAGGAQHQDQVEVPREGGLGEGERTDVRPLSGGGMLGREGC